MVIAIAFEAMHHIQHLGKARMFKGATSINRPVTAAANQHHRAMVFPLREMAHLIDEILIQLPIVTLHPRHQHCPDRVTHKEKLMIGSAVDEQGIGLLVEELFGLRGQKIFH